MLARVRIESKTYSVAVFKLQKLSEAFVLVNPIEVLRYAAPEYGTLWCFSIQTVDSAYEDCLPRRSIWLRPRQISQLALFFRAFWIEVSNQDQVNQCVADQ